MMTKINRRKKRQARIRAKISGTAVRPRLCVYRSNRGFYAQFINDDLGVTLFGKRSSGSSIAAAKAMAAAMVEAAAKLNITTIVFDRGGYKYHGTIKAIADAVREGGIKV